MIRHVYKPSKREGGKRVFDRLYRGRYRLDGEERIREVPLKTPDKQIAEQRLNKIILDEQREREGLLAPKAERDAAKRRKLRMWRTSLKRGGLLVAMKNT